MVRARSVLRESIGKAGQGRQRKVQGKAGGKVARRGQATAKGGSKVRAGSAAAVSPRAKAACLTPRSSPFARRAALVGGGLTPPA